MGKHIHNPLADGSTEAGHWDSLEDARLKCEDLLRHLDYIRFASIRQDISKAAMLIEVSQMVLVEKTREVWHAR